MNYKFPKTARLKKKKDFIFYQPRVFNGLYLRFFYIEGEGRMGLTFSKKMLKKSVDRNRLKRWARESYRHIRNGFFKCVDINVVGSKNLKNDFDVLSYENIQQDFKRFKLYLEKRAI